jgi:ribosome modulation factor
MQMTKLSAEERIGAAFLQGRAARKNGENIESCPYAPSTGTRDAWENGWYEFDMQSGPQDERPPAPLGPVDRTSAGLRSAMFDELDALRSGKTDAKRASAVAKMASSIIETVRLELDVAKWAGQKQLTRSGDSVALTAISFKPPSAKDGQ